MKIWEIHGSFRWWWCYSCCLPLSCEVMSLDPKVGFILVSLQFGDFSWKIGMRKLSQLGKNQLLGETIFGFNVWLPGVFVVGFGKLDCPRDSCFSSQYCKALKNLRDAALTKTGVIFDFYNAVAFDWNFSFEREYCILVFYITIGDLDIV